MAKFGLKQPRVIYFSKGMVPTEDEIKEAQRCGNNVVVRNASLVEPKLNPGQIEACEYVAGVVPPAYAAKYPSLDLSNPEGPATIVPLTAPPSAAPAAPADPASVGTEGTTPAAAPPAWKPNT